MAAVRESMQDQYQVLVDLGAWLGLRQGEIFGLALDDVDFMRRVVHIRRQVRIAGSKLVYALPKRGKQRDVPLPKPVSFALAEHLKARPAQPVTLPWDEPGGELVTAPLIVRSPTGLAVNRNSFNPHVWKPALQHAGVTPSRENGCHALRHYFASTLLFHGVDIRALSEYLGHDDPGFTLRVYGHLLPGAADRMRQAIEAASAEDHGPATAQGGL